MATLAEENKMPYDERMRETFGRKADWNMAIPEFDRWAKILKYGAEASIEMRIGNREACRKLFAAEAELIAEWTGMMNKKTREKFRTKIDTAGKMIQSIAERRGQIISKTGMIELLLEIWQDLFIFMYDVGLGVPMRQELEEDEKLKRSLR
jgi:hypothetical protein